MRHLFLLIVVSAGATACAGDIDCRHRDRECASGFVCLQNSSGAWDCAREEAGPGTEVEEPGEAVVSIPAEVRNDSRPSREPGPCPRHPECIAKSTECICDAGGNLTSRSIDRDGDGKPDERARFRRDGEGHVIGVDVDEGLDDTVDTRHIYRHNDAGNPVEWEIRRVGEGKGNGPDQRIAYVYDGQGNLVEERLDLEIDGTIDRRCEFSPPCPPPIPNGACKPVCR